MKREIRFIHLTTHRLISVWGFGSYFSGQVGARDIDLIAVIETNELDVEETLFIRSQFSKIEGLVGLPIDLTLLSSSEFIEAKLWIRDKLLPLMNSQ